jgi:predicted flap endonuclease-1-like 5' DNA nuclease
MRKYVKNPHPAYANGFRLMGTRFDDTTEVTGDEWEMWTKEQFPGKPPHLVVKKTGKPRVVEAVSKAVKKAPPPTRPSVLSTGRKNLKEARRGALKDGAKKKVAARKAEAKKEAAALKAREDKPKLPVVELSDIIGVGESREKALKRAGYKTVQSVAEADANELSKKIKRLTLGTARSIIRSAKAIMRRKR